MLIQSPETMAMEKHINAREGLVDLFNDMLEKILNENSHRKDLYYILGKVNRHRKGDVHIMRPFLKACLEKPKLIKQSFVYEVDNSRGTKTLLWVMHPGDMLSFPTLGKSVRIAGGENTGSTILLPK